jgi:hypothetical protein
VAARDEYLSAAGRLFATPADLARWGRAVGDARLVDLRLADGTMAGSVEARQVEGRPALWMQGSISGAGATVTVLPGEDVVVVVACNLASYPLFNSERVVSTIVFGVDPGVPPARGAAVDVSDAHRALVGDYDLPGVGPIRIHESGDEMRVTMLGPDWDYYLTPASQGDLVWRKFNFTFAARRDGAGAVNGLRVRLHMVGEAPGDFEAERLP